MPTVEGVLAALSPLAAGLAAGLSLIVAIGAQNAFVLRQGLRREHVLPVVLACAVSDALLIAAGIAGLGALLLDHPDAVVAVRWAGAAFLTAYGILALRRAVRPGVLAPRDQAPATLRVTIVTCLALTYLNPHVYLDTVLLLGTVANQHEHRWLFGAGAAAASAVWFTVLGVGAHRLAPLLARPAAWRVLDATIAAVMLVIAASLLFV